MSPSTFGETVFEAYDVGPPFDLNAEVAVLGSLFLQRPPERLRMIRELSPVDFHDVMNNWLFRSLRVFANLDGEELFARLFRFPGKPTEESVSASIALLLYSREGHARGNISLYPYYHSRLKEVSRRRELFDAGVDAIVKYKHDHTRGGTGEFAG